MTRGLRKHSACSIWNSCLKQVSHKVGIKQPIIILPLLTAYISVTIPMSILLPMAYTYCPKRQDFVNLRIRLPIRNRAIKIFKVLYEEYIVHTICLRKILSPIWRIYLSYVKYDEYILHTKRPVKIPSPCMKNIFVIRKVWQIYDRYILHTSPRKIFRIYNLYMIHT